LPRINQISKAIRRGKYEDYLLQAMLYEEAMNRSYLRQNGQDPGPWTTWEMIEQEVERQAEIEKEYYTTKWY
jgi:hypothetical protein